MYGDSLEGEEAQPFDALPGFRSHFADLRVVATRESCAAQYRDAQAETVKRQRQSQGGIVDVVPLPPGAPHPPGMSDGAGDQAWLQSPGESDAALTARFFRSTFATERCVYAAHTPHDPSLHNKGKGMTCSIHGA